MNALTADISGTLDSVEFIIIVLTFVVGVLGPLLWRLYRRLTQRERLEEALARLVPDVQISYFEEVLGARAQYRTPEEGYTENVWVMKDIIVQAVEDSSGQIHRYSVTVRNYRFKPRLPYGGYPVRHFVLGQDRLASIPADLIAGVHVRVAASTFDYAESHYFGRPGSYQTWHFAVTPLGNRSGDGAMLLHKICDELGEPGETNRGDFSPGSEYLDRELATRGAWAEYRETATVSTFGIVSGRMPGVRRPADPFRIGVWEHRVQALLSTTDPHPPPDDADQ